MATGKFPRVAVATQFARDVVRGKVPCCRFIVLACQRHLDDLAKSKTRDFAYRFDPAKAEKKLHFIEFLPHTKGEWARLKQKVKLEPWQAFGIACTFGWVRKKDGLRRFRESYWEVPRKNGKSVIAAGVALGMFCADGEFGAEVYSGATTEKQAWEVFRPARLMVNRKPELKDLLGIEVNAGNLNRPEDGSRFEPIIGKPSRPRRLSALQKGGRGWIRLSLGCLMAPLLMSCASVTPVTDTGCLWTRTIYVSQADVLTDGTARQVLAHNLARNRACSG